MLARASLRTQRPPVAALAAYVFAAAAGSSSLVLGNTSTEVRTYRTTTAAIANPERGFRAQLMNARRGQFPSVVAPGGPFPWPDPRLAHATDYNMTVVQTYCYLDSEHDELDSTFLASLDAGFERHREAGVPTPLNSCLYEL